MIWTLDGAGSTGSCSNTAYVFVAVVLSYCIAKFWTHKSSNWLKSFEVFGSIELVEVGANLGDCALWNLGTFGGGAKMLRLVKMWDWEDGVILRIWIWWWLLFLCAILPIIYIIVSIYCFCPFSCFNVFGHIGEDRQHFFKKQYCSKGKVPWSLFPTFQFGCVCVNSFGFSLVSLQLEIQTGLSCYTMLRHDLIHQNLMFLALEGMSKWYALDKRQALPWSGGSWTAFQRWQGPWNAACRWMAGKKSHRCGQECWVRKCCVKNLENMKVAHEIRLRYNQHLNQQTPTKNHSPLFFWCSSYMKIRISSRWMLLLLHQAHLEPGDPSLCRRPEWLGTHAYFLGHADGNPYASASVPWQ